MRATKSRRQRGNELLSLQIDFQSDGKNQIGKNIENSESKCLLYINYMALLKKENLEIAQIYLPYLLLFASLEK